ncbi:hypothetical protein RUND412_001842 [Rhizina undulata]
MKSSPTVGLLLTNLRLLDYDNTSDESFPITEEIFTSLKNKGKAFEQIAYHLFSTFDPEECALRLEGTWPIYEPAQSREFRNVIFKWLNDLKRTDHLGGNVLVRKTLLEDCCGERYEELLLALSTMVLRDQIEKNVFREMPRNTPAYQQCISLTPCPDSLSSLLLAHQVSLTQLLESRKHSKSQWSSFSSLLNIKESEIAALTQKLFKNTHDDIPKKLPRGYESEILSRWRNNWLGDQRWLDIILNGDPEFARDRLLELPFDKALAKHHHFKDGLVFGSGVSLSGLERQIKQQQDRIAELRKLKDHISRSSPMVNNKTPEIEVEKEKPIEKKGFQVEFDKHQKLHISQMKEIKSSLGEDENEYTELLESLREELAAAGAPNRRPRENKIISDYRYEPQVDIPEIACYPVETNDEDGMDIDELEVESPHKYDQSFAPSTPSQDGTQEDDSSLKPIRKISQQVEEYEQLQTAGSSAVSDDDDEQFYEASVVQPTPPKRHAEIDTIAPEFTQPHKRLQSRRNSLGFPDDELLAEQIVSSVTRAAYSPEKPSPVRQNQLPSHQPEFMDSPPSLPHESFGMGAGRLHYSPIPNLSQEQQSPLPTIDYHLSMPAKAMPSAATTPKEDLLISSDYNSVFKSRPKIAMSPPFTPSSASPVNVPEMSISGRRATPGIEEHMEGEDDDLAQNSVSPFNRKNFRRRT